MTATTHTALLRLVNEFAVPLGGGALDVRFQRKPALDGAFTGRYVATLELATYLPVKIDPLAIKHAADVQAFITDYAHERLEPWRKKLVRAGSKAIDVWEERKAASATRGNVAAEGNVGAGTQRGVHGEGVSHTLGDPESGRNLRSVWRIASKGYKGAHFATYPEELVERCILSGCPIEVCTTCGKPRVRLTDVEYVKSPAHGAGSVAGRREASGQNNFDGAGQQRLNKQVTTIGFSDCGHGTWRHGVVLDPFMGSGTTALVARRLGRRSVGIELNPEYAAMCARRLDTLQLLLPEAV